MLVNHGLERHRTMKDFHTEVARSNQKAVAMEMIGGLALVLLSCHTASAQESLSPEKAAEYAVHGITKEELVLYGPVKAANIQFESILMNLWPAAIYESGKISGLASEISELGQKEYFQSNSAKASLMGRNSFSELANKKECISSLYVAYQDSNSRELQEFSDQRVLSCIEQSDFSQTPLLSIYSLQKFLNNSKDELPKAYLVGLKEKLISSRHSLSPVHEIPFFQANYELAKRLGQVDRAEVIALWNAAYKILDRNLKGESYCGHRISDKTSALKAILQEPNAEHSLARKELYRDSLVILEECAKSNADFPSERFMIRQAISNLDSIISSIAKDPDAASRDLRQLGDNAYKTVHSRNDGNRFQWEPFETSPLDVEITYLDLLDARGDTDKAKKLGKEITQKILTLSPSFNDQKRLTYITSVTGLLSRIGLYDSAAVLAGRAESLIFTKGGIPNFQKTYAVWLLGNTYVDADKAEEGLALWARYSSQVLSDPSYSNQEKGGALENFASFVYLHTPSKYRELIEGNSRIIGFATKSPLLQTRILVDKARINIQTGDRGFALELISQAKSSLERVNFSQDFYTASLLADSIKDAELELSVPTKTVQYWEEKYSRNLERYGPLHRITQDSLFDVANAKISSGKDDLVLASIRDLEDYIQSATKTKRTTDSYFRTATLYLAILKSFIDKDKLEAAKNLKAFYVAKKGYRDESLRFLSSDQSGKEIVNQLTSYIISPYILGEVVSDIYSDEIDDLIINRGLATELDILRRGTSSGEELSLKEAAVLSTSMRESIKKQGVIIDSQEIQKRLDKSSVVITVAIARPVTEQFLNEVGTDRSQWDKFDRYVAIVISKESISAPIDIGLKSEIDALGISARAELTKPSHSSFSAIQKLQSIWLSAFSSQYKRNSQIMIVPAGIFTKLPSKLLEDKIEFTGESATFISELSVGRYLDQKTEKLQTDFVVFANPAYGDNNQLPTNQKDSDVLPRAVSQSGKWQQLPATKAEAQFLQENFSATSFLGKEATKNNLMRLSPPKVLHLATHAYYEDSISQYKDYQYSTPLDNAGIVFAGVNSNPDRSIVTARDLLTLNLEGTELVVLSACETALGDTPTNMSVYGLQRAFEVAGAQSVLAALWKVDDKATSIFIQEFYKSLMKGNSKTAALQEAQRTFQNHPIRAWSHPYFWAAFELYGSPQPMVLSSN